jgi:hypothetical protein
VSGDDAPGLREQIGATRDATKRLVGAHVELAKAELGEVMDEVKKVAILVGIAIAAGIAASLLLAVGMPLFLGELLFGSIGWGILIGLLLLAAMAVGGAVAALGVGGTKLGRAFGVALLIGVAVGVILALNLTHRGWTLAGESLLPLADAGPRPLVTAVLVLPIVVGLIAGLLAVARSLGGGAGAGSGPEVGARVAAGIPTAVFAAWATAFIYSYTSGVAWPDGSIFAAAFGGFVVTLVVAAIVGSWRPGFALVGGTGGGVAAGVFLGALTAIEFGRRVAAALGVTAGLIALIALLGLELARQGVDGEELMKRFKPQRTIDMTKETIEWARARMPLSRRS